MRQYFLIFGMVLLAACGDRQDNTTPVSSSAPVAAPEPAATSETTPAASATGARIWFEPAALKSCGKGQSVTVHWDASAVAGVRRVEVKPVALDKETVFVYSGVTGSKPTGNWVKAGAEFVLRNRAGGAELARAKVASLPCE